MATRSKPAIGITVGDPAGIGPEIASKAAADPRVLEVCTPVLYGPPGRRVVRHRTGLSRRPVRPRTKPSSPPSRMPSAAASPGSRPRRLTRRPLPRAGVPWRGHTELLAHLTGSDRVAMMFYSDVLRVVLATVHIPLADVPATLTRERLEETIALTASELPRFGWPSPRLALAGLNPHAGEHGLMGLEDDAVLAPAVAASAGARHCDRRAAPSRYRVRAGDAWRVRRRDCVLPRSRFDSREAGRVRPRRQRHAGPAHRPDLGRPWHGVRYCRAGSGGSVEPRSRRAARGPAGGCAWVNCFRSGRRSRFSPRRHGAEASGRRTEAVELQTAWTPAVVPA